MTSLLAALDDSATARVVVDTAMAIAPCWGADVIAMHVGDSSGGTARRAAASAGKIGRASCRERVCQYV